MQIRFWGVRGSYPASGARFSEFGHHTACVAVTVGDDLIVLDAGTGAAALGEVLRANPVRHLHVLFSHFHHDHIVGLPFLLHGAGASPDTTISVHSALPVETSLESVIRRFLSAPYFPDEAGDLFGRVAFTHHAPGERFDIRDTRVETALVEHPGGSCAYRLTRSEGSLVYVTDIEEASAPAPALARLAGHADVLVHDTMFTQGEIDGRRGWGHSTSEAALALAREAGVRRLVGFHHSPNHDDAMLAAREREFVAARPGSCFAREGQIIALSPP
jgi:phosphoribosyl 1,2-cyclic phosphodiesterase